jgi:hypothetical protein
MAADTGLELTAMRTLYGDQQFVADRRQAKAAPQFLLDVQEQVGGGFGVGQCAVEAAGVGQAQCPREGAELVIGRVGKESPGQKHGAGEFLVPLPPYPAEFGIPELAVEGGVVGDHGMIADEVRGFAHHRLDAGGMADHVIGDTGQRLYVVRDQDARVHQALVATGDPVAVDEDNRDFSRPRAMVRR